MSVSVLYDGACLLGEGPHWEEATSTLLYVDIHGKTVNKWNVNTKQNSSVELDGYVGFAVPRTSGGYIVGKGRKFCHLDWDSGKTSVLHKVPMAGTNDVPDNRINDGKCDPSGRVWAGLMTRGETEVCNLYSLERDGSIKQRLDKISLSNGLAWTSDSRTMYYTDTVPQKIYAYDFDINTGDLSNQQVAIDFNNVPELSSGPGKPDGCCIDTEDKLWIACARGGKVIRVDPETGKIIQTIDFPVSFTTSCCFGGPHYDTLYVTSGRVHPSGDLRQKEPNAGAIFQVTGLGAKGLPPQAYVG